MFKLTYRAFFVGWVMALGLLACARTQPEIIIVTATFEPSSIVEATQPTFVTATAAVSELAVVPSPNPRRTRLDIATSDRYTVQAGDTLGTIANANGVSLQALTELNNIENPDFLSVGQILQLPAAPTGETPNLKLISNTRFVRSESGSQFDVGAFVATRSGYIREATDQVEQSLANGFRQEVTLTATQVINRVSLEYSVDPRLLLALLEYRAGWLTRPTLSDEAILYPMGEVDGNRQGLYKQLAWTADRLNRGYYGWRYRGIDTLQFDEGERLLYNGELNAGTVGIQYFLSLNNGFSIWQEQVSPGGFDVFYRSLFGDPFVEETQPLIPADLIQPEFVLPFANDEVWFYTGGPHGGWGSGSAWSAVDFAPPDDVTQVNSACYTSQFPVRALAAGNIVRSDGGAVILDLDADSNEATGWTVLYLHIAAANRVTSGRSVQAGDVIGYAACEGGFSTATHVHIGRRYNGEWIPAYCHQCDGVSQTPPFVMSGWTVIGFENQEYQGIMRRGNEQRQAEQGRQNPINRVTW